MGTWKMVIWAVRGGMNRQALAEKLGTSLDWVDMVLDADSARLIPGLEMVEE